MLDEGALNDAMRRLPRASAQRLRTYVDEALFFESVLASDLARLPRSAGVIEIGSGIGLLSLLMGARGFSVTSFEPASAGFGEMSMLRGIVLNAWTGPTDAVTWIDHRIDEVPIQELRSDYAVAVNVIEHVRNWKKLVVETVGHLKDPGQFRVICPNSAYPYEAHFNMPTLFSKRLTGKIFQSRIFESQITEPEQFWDDLSWPTGRKLRRGGHEMGLELHFRSEATLAYLRRFGSDSRFRQRKGRLSPVLGRAALQVLPHIAGAMPPTALPILDCTFQRNDTRVSVPGETATPPVSGA